MSQHRRAFLEKVGWMGAGLTLGVHIPSSSRSIASEPRRGEPRARPNAFIRISDDSTVTVLIKHLEFGQGVMTGLATLVAEELDAAWSQMRAESAPSNPDLYINFAYGMQGTGGSTSISNAYLQMRTVGASARVMLVAAAARRWGISTKSIEIRDGIVSDGKRRARFGELAEDAMALSPPTTVELKKESAFKLIGTDLPRLSTSDKLDGRARYTIDIARPDMLSVVVARPTRFGARLKSFDPSEAKKVSGFAAAQAISSGVAVYAEGHWAARKARDALKIQWDETRAETRGSEDLIAEYRKLLEHSGRPVKTRGKPPARETQDQILSADYVFPFLAHAPLEPLDIVLERTAGGARAWFGSQLTTIDHAAIAEVLGLEHGRVELNVIPGGGSFGRRAQHDCHLAREGAEALQRAPGGRPVQLLWTREDDITGGYYRPIYVHRIEALLRKGRLMSWQHRIVGPSILGGTPFEGMLKGGVDPTSVEGADSLPYACPHFALDLHSPSTSIPVLWWRSVGSTHTGFSTETFIDEVIEAMGEKDPVEGRLALLAGAPRHRGALRAAAQLAGWPRSPRAGRALGVALHKSYGSHVAAIAEVSLANDGMPIVHRVWCGIDCGIPINPDIIRAQMEGGLGYGLGAALYNEVPVEKGRPQVANFDTYRPLRMTDMPEIEVEVVKSSEPPTGVGEPGLPVMAPALANAYRRLTGRAVRRLPFSRFVQSPA